MARFHKDKSIFASPQTSSGAGGVFEGHGMGCSLRLGAQFETIETGAILHQADPDRVVAELYLLDRRR